MSDYRGEVEFEYKGVKFKARGTWAVFERVESNTGHGPVDLYDRFVSGRWHTRDIGYLLYYGFKAVDPSEQETSPESILKLTYKQFVEGLEAMDKQDLSSICAEFCILFLRGKNSLDEITVIEPDDGQKKSTASEKP